MAAAHTDTEIPQATDPRIWAKYKEDHARLDAMTMEKPVRNRP